MDADMSSCGGKRGRARREAAPYTSTVAVKGKRCATCHVFAGSTLHDLPADRHNDLWKFAVVGVDDNRPLHRTNADFFGD